jgi:predicted nucleic-acid-binding Zn-ribbon protein
MIFFEYFKTLLNVYDAAIRMRWLDLKQSERCPKCNSTNIWNNAHITVGNILKRWVPVCGSTWPPWKRKYAFKVEYVCLDCGYSETYIDKEGLQTIREYRDLQS